MLTIIKILFYLNAYVELKDFLTPFLSPQENDKNLSTFENTLDLYPNITKRQQTFILDILNKNLSYKELSQEYCVSISTVKKDMVELFKLFCVRNREELKILLLKINNMGSS